MPVITVFNGSFCRQEPVINGLISETGYTFISDRDLISTAARLSGMSVNKIERAFASKTSVFNKFTHEKERATSYLRLAMAQTIGQDNLVLAGFATHLIAGKIDHVLRVCIIADMKFRVSEAAESQVMTPKEATKLIHRQDEDKAVWVNKLRNVKDPWDPSLYDIVIPMNKMAVADALSIIKDNLGKDIFQTPAASQPSIRDFLMAAKMEVALAKQGHHFPVNAKDGEVAITINKQVLTLGKLEQELKSIAEKVEGVREVKTKVGRDFYRAGIYRRYDFEVPSRILLVDDEREFVTTLSERLLMRDMGSVVAYDGRSALDLIESDEPDIMILDLRMPGIDGIEVLRRVKKSNPNVEVIILTGHGSEQDRETCMELGAFAYLQKPVDIDRLSETLKKANAKARAAGDKI